ncbi:copper chaperone PCu(A)C [Allorhizobium terrae]|uniref:Copper chaperone PCu(A)C n=1 Tax=Allorhizobium terrae TaxID=1848972 RepID=A0A4S3ZWI3_9HYPH|nr:copper chaperone PCu(A)C [Allorhizobium terrae]THF50183.1 copper chaperone PCu(A)C [Allorhizobium terrae]
MKRLLITIAAVSALLLAQPAFSQDVKVGELHIIHPIARAMLPGAQVGGGYLTIDNEGATDDRLVGGSSPRARSIQVHEMKIADGVMSMNELKQGLAVPAKTKTELKPGSYHLMFMNVEKPFQQGEKIKAVLNFEKAGPVEVEFTVVAPNGDDKSAPAHDHHEMPHTMPMDQTK